MDIIKYDPAEIVMIKVGDLTAPIAAGTEVSKLYSTAEKIYMDLIKDISRDPETGKLVIPPDLLNWQKELRMLAESVHKLTGEVEGKVHLKKLELTTKLFEEFFKSADHVQKIEILQALRDGKDPTEIKKEDESRDT
jgi:hypothetical protein